MSKEKLNRSEIREKALQTLFPMYLNVDLTKEEAIEHALCLEDNMPEVPLIPEYLNTLVTGVLACQKEIDVLIGEHLAQNWSITRISKLDLMILRMATFEMKYVEDEEVPKVVAVDEAVELAKKYSDPQGAKFINGVLSNMMAELTKE